MTTKKKKYASAQKRYSASQKRSGSFSKKGYGEYEYDDYGRSALRDAPASRKKKSKKGPAAEERKRRARAEAARQAAKRKKRRLGDRYFAPLAVLAIALVIESALFFPTSMGRFGELVRSLLFGLFGAFGAIALPAAVVALAFFRNRLRRNRVLGRKILLALLSVILLSVSVQFIGAGIPAEGGFPTVQLWLDGTLGLGGGIVGGIPAIALSGFLGRWLGCAVSVLLFALCLSFTLGSTGTGIWQFLLDALCIRLPGGKPKADAPAASKRTAAPSSSAPRSVSSIRPSAVNDNVVDPFKYGSEFEGQSSSSSLPRSDGEQSAFPQGRSTASGSFSPYTEPLSYAQPETDVAPSEEEDDGYDELDEEIELPRGYSAAGITGGAELFRREKAAYPSDGEPLSGFSAYASLSRVATEGDGKRVTGAQQSSSSSRSFGAQPFSSSSSQPFSVAAGAEHGYENMVFTETESASSFSTSAQYRADTETADTVSGGLGFGSYSSIDMNNDKYMPSSRKPQRSVAMDEPDGGGYGDGLLEDDGEDEEDDGDEITAGSEYSSERYMPSDSYTPLTHLPEPEPEEDDGKKYWEYGNRYEYPTTDLLNPVMRQNTVSEEEIREVADKLLRKLASFKISASLVGYSVGPSITRYELSPGEGVRVKSISQLLDDLTLELAAEGVRIEAPIPGKAAVGVEVPNKKVSVVSFRSLVESPEFTKAKSKITVCIGLNVTGKPVFMDIDDMPHVLIAGQTKSGKSVAINCMLLSLLFRVSPDEVKLILVDPKRVELNIYGKLPHLVMPVVDDPKRAAAALSWAVKEMERRYDLMEKVSARNRDEYRRKTASDPNREDFPQLVIIIDELADLMLQVREHVEPLINRLAAKARACGIHLLIGTQRPSVDVLTGLIKANIPARIAFKVAEQVDSRTILGNVGAEKLLGRGDMLYQPTGCARVRVQGAFVDGDEISNVVDYIIENNGEARYDPDIMAQIDEEAAALNRSGKRGGIQDDDMGGEKDKKKDPLFYNAVEIAVTNQSIATSALQRYLEVGYGRAAKLIDSMEKMGIVGPPNGAKPRDVLMTMEQYQVWRLDQRFEDDD